MATHRVPDALSKTMDELPKLPPGDRIELAMALWDTLTDTEHDAELVLTDELRAELDRRWEEHLANPKAAIPWEVVRAKHERML